jgi:uncharacterized protein
VGEEGIDLGLIGIIADMHGKLHPRVVEVFSNVDAIIHAGDAGGEQVLEALRRIAPVTFVRDFVDSRLIWTAVATNL